MDGADPEAMRLAARSVAAGVVLVTSFVSDRPWGVTATGFSVISIDPPTVMVSLARHSALAGAVAAGRVFGVSVLTEDALLIAGRHAVAGAPKFMAADDLHAASLTPVAARRSAHFDCRLVRSLDVADHLVCFGEVSAILDGAGEGAAQPRPLVYCGAAYFGINPTALMAAQKFRPTRRTA